MTEQPLAHTNAQLTRIEELMALMEGTKDPRGAVVREHLRSARAYLLGVMPVEYVSTLELAQGAVNGFSDGWVRQRVKEDIAHLLAERSQPRTSPTKWRHRPDHGALQSADRPSGSGDLSSWFGESATSVGVFYPTDYIIAIFQSAEIAQAALRILREANFGDLEARAADGAEVLAFMKRLRGDQGIWGELMTRISRAIDTEATFADKDIRLARKGAGFLAVHCRSENESEHITELVAPLRPLEMQWYLAGGIRSLV